MAGLDDSRATRVTALIDLAADCVAKSNVGIATSVEFVGRNQAELVAAALLALSNERTRDQLARIATALERDRAK